MSSVVIGWKTADWFAGSVGKTDPFPGRLFKSRRRNWRAVFMQSKSRFSAAIIAATAPAPSPAVTFLVSEFDIETEESSNPAKPEYADKDTGDLVESQSRVWQY